MQRGENRVIRGGIAHDRNYVSKNYINKNYVNKDYVNYNRINNNYNNNSHGKYNKELKEDLIIQKRPVRQRESSAGGSRKGAVRAREAAWYREEMERRGAGAQAPSYRTGVKRRPAYREYEYGTASRGRDEFRGRELHVRRREMRRRKKKLRRLKRTVLLFGMITVGILSVAVMRSRIEDEKAIPVFNLLMPFNRTVEAPEIQQLYLTPNEYSRPGDKLGKVKNIFVHYTANPETSARQNRSYFENLKDTHERSASAHFIIGYEGEIVQCIPLEEQAYAVMTRNGDSLSVECCYISEDGSFTQETYDSLVSLLAWLLCEYRLEPEDILRHYDCGGKLCPIYYVENEAKWEQLKRDVADYIEEENK